MASVKRDIYVEAPLEVVFNLVADTPQLVAVWPSLQAINNFTRDENGMATFDFVYQMAGFRFKGRNHDVEFIPNERIVTKSLTGLDSTITWEMVPERRGTRIFFQGEYRVPIPLIGWIAENIIVSLNELDVDLLMTNLKRRAERQRRQYPVNY